MKKAGKIKKRLIALATVLIALNLIFVSEISASSVDKKLGVGMAIPASITIKLWTNVINSVDIKIGWNLDNDKSRICFDYLWHNFDFFSETENLNFYYGLGGKFCSGEKKDRLGLRITFGINYIFREAPFDFFMEISPTLQLSPSTKLEIDPAIGLRYFF